MTPLTIIRRYLAKRRLAHIVERNLRSFEVQDYRRRREAMLRHTRGVVA